MPTCRVSIRHGGELCTKVSPHPEQRRARLFMPRRVSLIGARAEASCLDNKKKQRHATKKQPNEITKDDGHVFSSQFPSLHQAASLYHSADLGS